MPPLFPLNLKSIMPAAGRSSGMIDSARPFATIFPMKRQTLSVFAQNPSPRGLVRPFSCFLVLISPISSSPKNEQITSRTEPWWLSYLRWLPSKGHHHRIRAHYRGSIPALTNRRRPKPHIMRVSPPHMIIILANCLSFQPAVDLVLGTRLIQMSQIVQAPPP